MLHSVEPAYSCGRKYAHSDRSHRFQVWHFDPPASTHRADRKSYRLRINGLHIHTGSEILDASVFLRVAELLFEAAGQFPDLEFIDFGSGFKVAYKEGDVVTDLEELGRDMSARFREFCQAYGRPLQLWFEPGKYLVSESGLLLVRANVVKQTLATVFVGVDSDRTI